MPPTHKPINLLPAVDTSLIFVIATNFMQKRNKNSFVNNF